MRKYTSLIILVIFLFNIGGYYLWFSILQKGIQSEVRHEIGEGLKDENLALVIVPLNDQGGISWIEQGKEFSYKGEMYDVVRIEIKNQDKYFFCIKDIKEKQLIAGYYKNHNSKKEADKKIKLAFNFQYFTQQFSLKIVVSKSDLDFPEMDLLYNSNFSDIHSPPPELT